MGGLSSAHCPPSRRRVIVASILWLVYWSVVWVWLLYQIGW